MGTEVQGPAPPLAASPHRQAASPPRAPVSSRVNGEKQVPTPSWSQATPWGRSLSTPFTTSARRPVTCFPPPTEDDVSV